MSVLNNIDWIAVYGAFHLTCCIAVMILFLDAQLNPPTSDDE